MLTPASSRPTRILAQRRTSHAGFTWSEVLVVLLLVMLLALVLLPVLSTSRTQCDLPRCLTNLQQIGMGLKLYAKDHYGGFPPNLVGGIPLSRLLRDETLPRSHFEVALDSGSIDHHPTGHYRTWMDSLGSYVKSSDLSVFICSSHEGQTAAYPSYGYSVALGGYGAARYLFGKDRETFRPARTQEVVKPQRVVVVMEFYDPHSYRLTPADLRSKAAIPSNTDIAPHNGGGFVVYADGHAKWQKQEVWADLARGTAACNLHAPDKNSQYCEKAFNPFLD